MKSMSCKQLGGACNEVFRANTFDEIVELSKKHGREMYNLGDKDHIKAMEEMRQLMQTPDKMTEWFNQKKKEFQLILDE